MTIEQARDYLREAEDILDLVRRSIENWPQSFEVDAALKSLNMARDATEEARTWL